jgi:hypothetical protein
MHGSYISRSLHCTRMRSTEGKEVRFELNIVSLAGVENFCNALPLLLFKSVLIL